MEKIPSGCNPEPVHLPCFSCFRASEYPNQSLSVKWALLTAFIFLLYSLPGNLPPQAMACNACLSEGTNIYILAELKIEDETLQGIHMHWHFSESLSKTIYSIHSADDEIELDADEKQSLTAYFAETIQQNHFMTHLSINGQKIDAPAFENLLFEWHPKQSRISFFIPLQYPVGDALDLTLTTIDPAGQLRFFYFDDGVSWNSPEGYILNTEMAYVRYMINMQILTERSDM